MMTDKLPRFNVPNGNAVFSPEGRLVRYSDHAATVERLTRERDLLWREHQKAGHECADLLAALTASEARVAEMREALEPFTQFPVYLLDRPEQRWVLAPQPEHWVGGGWFALSDFTKARAALASGEKR